VESRYRPRNAESLGSLVPANRVTKDRVGSNIKISIL
jgi:hypothetical protein